MSESPLVLGSRLGIHKNSVSAHNLRELRRTFTLQERAHSSYGKPKSIAAYTEDRDYIYIPRASREAWDLTDKYKWKDDRSGGSRMSRAWLGEFREGQEKFVNRAVSGIEDLDEVIAQAGCGFGKTVCGTAIASRIGRTTLVATHKKALMLQWKVAFKKFLGIDAGIVQSSTCDFEGREVVIAMMQSLAQTKYPDALYRWPGLVIVDECHRVGAPTFSDAITQFPSRYRLGLTATPRRGDKMEDLFYWHLGGIEARGIGKFLDCIVKGISTGVKIPDHLFYLRGKPHLSKLVTQLCEHEERTDLIIRLALKAARAGRKLLILTARVAHVELLVERLSMHFKIEGSDMTAGNFARGSTKKAVLQQETAAAATVTVATWPMASEGLDIPEKDTLIAATPVKDIEQAAGRIRRLLDGKKDPLILHLIDDHGICQGLWNKCNEFYRSESVDKEPWPVERLGVD